MKCALCKANFETKDWRRRYCDRCRAKRQMVSYENHVLDFIDKYEQMVDDLGFYELIDTENKHGR